MTRRYEQFTQFSVLSTFYSLLDLAVQLKSDG